MSRRPEPVLPARSAAAAACRERPGHRHCDAGAQPFRIFSLPPGDHAFPWSPRRCWRSPSRFCFARGIAPLRQLPVAFAISLAGVASHLLLDWTNAYGVRFLLPFSSGWYSLDLNNIIDVWMWAVLILAAVGPWVGRLVSSEVGARSGSGRGLAIFALAFAGVVLRRALCDSRTRAGGTRIEDLRRRSTASCRRLPDCREPV